MKDLVQRQEAEGCDASGMASRFGADEMIFVKAHLEDCPRQRSWRVRRPNGHPSLPTNLTTRSIDGDPVDDRKSRKRQVTCRAAWIYTVDEGCPCWATT